MFLSQNPTLKDLNLSSLLRRRAIIQDVTRADDSDTLSLVHISAEESRVQVLVDALHLSFSNRLRCFRGADRMNGSRAAALWWRGPTTQASVYIISPSETRVEPGTAEMNEWINKQTGGLQAAVPYKTGITREAASRPCHHHGNSSRSLCSEWVCTSVCGRGGMFFPSKCLLHFKCTSKTWNERVVMHISGTV